MRLKSLIGTLVALSAFSTIQPVRAENWSPILSCENGQAVLDVNSDERRQLQLVIRGNLLERLYHERFASPQFGDREYIFSGVHAGLARVSPTETEMKPLGGVFHPSDFRSLMIENTSPSGGSSMQIVREGDLLVLKRYLVRAGTSCSGGYSPEPGVCRGHFRRHRTYDFLGEFILRGCSER